MESPLVGDVEVVLLLKNKKNDMRCDMQCWHSLSASPDHAQIYIPCKVTRLWSYLSEVKNTMFDAIIKVEGRDIRFKHASCVRKFVSITCEDKLTDLRLEKYIIREGFGLIVYEQDLHDFLLTITEHAKPIDLNSARENTLLQLIPNDVFAADVSRYLNAPDYFLSAFPGPVF
jgi:hypothetical protein